MWINLNSSFYINLENFFKIPYALTGDVSGLSCRLLYNSSIDKFFLQDPFKRLIYLDKTETHNSYVESYLINDFYNYKSKLKPYNTNTLCYLRSDALNAIRYNYTYGTLENINQFQTEDEKYVAILYKLPKIGAQRQTVYNLIVCSKIDFEDGIILNSNNTYITNNFYSKSEKLIFRGYGNSIYTNSILRRSDLDSKDVDYNLKNYFYIKTNPISFVEPNPGNRPENKLPMWFYNTDRKEYIFDTLENELPDDIPQTLKIFVNVWEIDLSFLGISYYKKYDMFSFEDDYSDKENPVRYGFSSRNLQLSDSYFYKNYSGKSIMFVIEFSDELNGYKLFDINNPKAGYFLCSENNCLKEHTSYRFKAFLDETKYTENVLNHYKSNDLILTWKDEEEDYYYGNAIFNNSYKYCLNKIKKLSTIYNTQIPFIRF